MLRKAARPGDRALARARRKPRKTGSKMGQPPEETERAFRAFVTSFNTHLHAGQLEEWMRNWTEDAERITPEGTARGIAAIRDFYAKYIAARRGATLTPKQVVIQGNRVACEGIVETTDRLTGRKTILPVAMFFELRGSQLCRAHAYFDTAVRPVLP